VNDSVEPYRGKALEALAGARSELRAARFNNAANRAYYAAYNAAIVALVRAGLNSRGNFWGHDEVQARMSGDLINRRKLFPADLAQVLYDLREIREQGDYGIRIVSRRRADAAVRTTERFVLRLLGNS
jgi:uncharacterized protein (UPF0332 family)